MLSDDELDLLITLHAPPIHPDFKDDDDFIELARAIEAECEKVPEGWVAVPKMPTLAMLDCLRSDTTSNLEKRYQAMIAAAPKPTQASPQEPVKDEPVAWMVVTPYDKLIFQNASQAEHYAEKWELVSAPLYTRPQQEPVKDEPVALVDFNLPSNIAWMRDKGMLPHGTKLYTRPQDLTAEVERLKKELMLSHMAARAEAHELDHANERIAELEEAAREARDALQYKLHVVEAIAKLYAVLGNAEVNGGRLADRPSEAV